MGLTTTRPKRPGFFVALISPNLTVNTRSAATIISPMITPSAIQSRIEAGVTALDAADYAAAISHFESAAALMAGVPDFKAFENEVTWKPEQLDAVIARVRRLERKASGSGAIRQQPIERVRG